MCLSECRMGRVPTQEKPKSIKMYYKDHVKSFETSFIDLLADNMCPVDKEEVYATSGYSPKTALLSSVMRSDQLVCYFAQEELLGIGGVGLEPNGDGVPWFLRTNHFDSWKQKNLRSFLRSTKSWIEHMGEIYPAMYNYVDVRNKESINWLKHLGFSLTNTIDKYGFLKVPFIKFEKYNR
jgi:hypothetical protein